jgi:hypothetical protein
MQRRAEVLDGRARRRLCIGKLLASTIRGTPEGPVATFGISQTRESIPRRAWLLDIDLPGFYPAVYP